MTTKTTEMNTCFCSVSKVYLEPLAAALNSNRTILNYADIQIIFNPVTQILELNRWPHPNTHQNQYVWCTQLCGHKLSAVCFGCSVFQEDLQTRLQQWGPQQCVGDVFVKLCSRLRVYTNYLNNYTTALCTIDKVNKTVVLSIQHTSTWCFCWIWFDWYCCNCVCVCQCRETKPAFRAFLKRVDRTLTTHMLRY